MRESAEISPQALRLFFYLQFCFVLDDDEDNEKYEEEPNLRRSRIRAKKSWKACLNLLRLGEISWM